MFKKFLSFQQWFWTKYLTDGPARFGFSMVLSLVGFVLSLILAAMFNSTVPLMVFGITLIVSAFLALIIMSSIFIRNRVQDWRIHYEREQRHLFNTIKNSERQY
jgi:antibiotic biosynthesis monooxygenase (ABM) superfamily enzyme